MILGLSIVSTLACAAILHWFSKPNVTLDSAVHLLAADLRHIQSRAAYEQRSFCVHFFKDGRGYQVLTGDRNPVSAPVGGAPFVRQYNRDAVFAGVRITSTEFEGPSGLVYTPLGPTTGSGRVCLEFAGEQRCLEIIDDHGRLALADYPKSTE